MVNVHACSVRRSSSPFADRQGCSVHCTAQPAADPGTGHPRPRRASSPAPACRRGSLDVTRYSPPAYPVEVQRRRGQRYEKGLFEGAAFRAASPARQRGIRLTIAALHKHRDYGSGLMDPGLRKLTEETGLGETALRETLRWLWEEGFLEIVPRKRFDRDACPPGWRGRGKEVQATNAYEFKLPEDHPRWPDFAPEPQDELPQGHEEEWDVSEFSGDMTPEEADALEDFRAADPDSALGKRAPSQDKYPSTAHPISTSIRARTKVRTFRAPVDLEQQKALLSLPRKKFGEAIAGMSAYAEIARERFVSAAGGKSPAKQIADIGEQSACRNPKRDGTI